MARVVAIRAALLFERRTASLCGEAAALGGCGGPSQSARGSGFGGTAEQRDQAIERILAVSLLGAKAAGSND